MMANYRLSCFSISISILVSGLLLSTPSSADQLCSSRSHHCPVHQYCSFPKYDRIFANRTALDAWFRQIYTLKYGDEALQLGVCHCLDGYEYSAARNRCFSRKRQFDVCDHDEDCDLGKTAEELAHRHFSCRLMQNVWTGERSCRCYIAQSKAAAANYVACPSGGAETFAGGDRGRLPPKANGKMLNNYYKTFSNQVSNYYQNALKSYYQRHMDYHNSYRIESERVAIETTPRTDFYDGKGGGVTYREPGTNYLDAKYVIVGIIWIIAAYLLLVNLIRRKGTTTYSKTASDDPDGGYHCGGAGGAGRCVGGGGKAEYGSFGSGGGGGKFDDGSGGRDSFKGRPDGNNNPNKPINGNNNPNFGDGGVKPWGNAGSTPLSPPADIPKDTNSTTYYENLLSIGQTLMKLSPFSGENGKRFAYDDNGNRNHFNELQSVKVQEAKNGGWGPGAGVQGYPEIGDF